MDPTLKAVRVANYIKQIDFGVGIISHSCGVREPRELNRSHARIVTENGLSVSIAARYAEKESGIKMKKVLQELG